MTNRERKIRDAIAECDRFIAKEEPRAADLRPADIAERLEWYRQHRATLSAMLSDPDGPCDAAAYDGRPCVLPAGHTAPHAFRARYERSIYAYWRHD